MKCVILAGGSGDRLWPLSRKNDPKQFLRLGRDTSIFQDTITRNLPLCDSFLIITNKDYRDTVENQMQSFAGSSYQVILEEKGWGTAAAVALAAMSYHEDEEILIMPSDLVMSPESYSDSVYEAKRLSEAGGIVLFGITPESPSLTYGYIRHEGNRVTQFLEKPKAELAKSIFSDENVYWNSGMIMARCGVLLEGIKKAGGDFARRLRPIYDQANIVDSHTVLFEAGLFSDVPKKSIEELLLEEAKNLFVIRLRCDWSDVSDFASVKKVIGNNGDAPIITRDCDGTDVLSTSTGRAIVINDISDAYVVDTPDALYVTSRGRAEGIREIIHDHAGKLGDYFFTSPIAYRQWGTREVIHREPGYRVRKIVVYPGGSISRHTHEKRNENYSVVSGVLSIELVDRTVELGQGEGINILPGMIHRVYNATDSEVVAIEVDTGAEIEEQDMVYSVSETSSALPTLYRLHPEYKDYLWGGTRLKDVYDKDTPYDITAESWELSAHPAGPSTITGGQFDGVGFDKFVMEYGDEVLGWKSQSMDRFPILVKFIDAKNKLSIQIHPDDDYAYVNEGEFGKNELWYVMDAEPGATLYCGLNRSTTKDEIKKRLLDGTLTEILNEVSVKKGDVIFIPTGTIHAIGSGVFVCEIQQSSNSTYRLYDYDRVDKDGKKRPLHIEKALDVVDTEQYINNSYGYSEPVRDNEGNIVQTLCRCKYFESVKYDISDQIQIRMDDATFMSVVILEGAGKIYTKEECMEFAAGESIFISAGRKVVHIEGRCELIATHI